MGYNARNDEIRDNVTRMQREWEAQRGALATFPPKAMFGSGPRSRRSHLKTSLVDYRLRQLRHRGRSGFASEAA
jgi:hypothetical protein